MIYGILNVFSHFNWDLKVVMIIYRNLLSFAGKVVKDSEFFQNDKFIWPEGYTAMRKFTSLKGPNSWIHLLFSPPIFTLVIISFSAFLDFHDIICIQRHE